MTRWYDPSCYRNTWSIFDLRLFTLLYIDVNRIKRKDEWSSMTAVNKWSSTIISRALPWSCEVRVDPEGRGWSWNPPPPVICQRWDPVWKFDGRSLEVVYLIIIIACILLNIILISTHPITSIQCKVWFHLWGLVELWGTRSKQKLQIETVKFQSTTPNW